MYIKEGSTIEKKVSRQKKVYVKFGKTMSALERRRCRAVNRKSFQLRAIMKRKTQTNLEYKTHANTKNKKTVTSRWTGKRWLRC